VLNFVDEHLAEPGIRDLIAAFDNQVSLSGFRGQADLAASVTVRERKAVQWLPGHLEIPQHTMIYERHSLSRYAFIIEGVIAQ
jgi:hypothetical protein